MLRFRHSIDASRVSRTLHQCMITNPAECLVRVRFEIRSEERISCLQYVLLLFSLSRKMPVIQNVLHKLCKFQYLNYLITQISVNTTNKLTTIIFIVYSYTFRLTRVIFRLELYLFTMSLCSFWDPRRLYVSVWDSSSLKMTRVSGNMSL